MQLEKMAAESAGLKKQAPTAWYIRMTEEVTTDKAEAEKWRGVPLVRVDFETPTMDAFQAEVRATSLEDFADVMAEGGHYDVANYATTHSQKIRKGVQS